MRLRLGLCGFATLLLLPIACAFENPAFDDPAETVAEETAETVADGPETSADNGEGPALCDLAGGVDMTIRVPQPCGETNDALGTYEHWFLVEEVAGSIWGVKLCDDPMCEDCGSVVQDLEISPLPVGDLAGVGDCLEFAGRRLGQGDDCNYHAISVRNLSADASTVLMARRTELLEIPTLNPVIGVTDFDPILVPETDATCSCAEFPDSCCDGAQPPTLYYYMVDGQAVHVGDPPAPVTLALRPFDFWAFDAFNPGGCDATTNIAWAVTERQP